MKERIVWLDYGKTIAIYLVVLAHTALYKPAEGFIYTFHMPFFFFMSGYLFSYSKYPSYMEFVKRRFRQLLVPYVVINMITYLLWLLVLRNVGSDAGEDVGALSPLMAAVTVNATEMVHDVRCGSLPRCSWSRTSITCFTGTHGTGLWLPCCCCCLWC